MKNHVAKVLTPETAWKLIAFLGHELAHYDPPLRFMVVLPDPGTIEVWPAVGSPLRKVDQVAVAKVIKTFRGLSSRVAPGNET